MKPSQTDLKFSNRASVPGNTISGRMGEGGLSGPAFFPPKGAGCRAEHGAEFSVSSGAPDMFSYYCLINHSLAKLITSSPVFPYLIMSKVTDIIGHGYIIFILYYNI